MPIRNPTDPISLPADNFILPDLEAKVAAAIAGDDAGRYDRVNAALSAAAAYADEQAGTPTPSPTPTPTPAPVFTVQPSISPGSGTAGSTLFTANDGISSNTTGKTRRWLLSGTSIGTASTVTPGSAGSLALEVTATGPGGSKIETSSAVTVAAAPAPTPTPTPTPTQGTPDIPAEPSRAALVAA